MMILSTYTAGWNIFITFIAILITVGLGLLFYFLYQKERKRFLEDNDVLIDGMVSKNQLASDVNFQINRSSVGTSFSLIYIDIDTFTGINESFGRHTGDQILKTIGQEILKVAPRRSVISRIKGDQFIIFVRNEYSRTELYRITDRLLETISAPIIIGRDTEIQLTASLGIAIYPDHGINYKKLLENLELAVYISKRNGGNKATEYSVDMAQTEKENLDLFNQVKDAIVNKEFRLFYHPIIHVTKNDLIGMESLIRWNHPIHGLLSPYKFLSIMEQSGDINWVGLWGLESLIQQQKEWEQQFPKKPLFLTLNLSPKQLLNPNISEEFRKLIKKYKANPTNIGLEVADFSIFGKLNDVQTNILKLRDMGFKICIEGMALDYNALTKLATMPIDVIKLDRSFMGLEDRNYMKEKFVEMLVEFAKEYDRLVIAEGVEDQEGLEYAKHNRIDIAQGYLFAKPLAHHEMTKYILEERWLEVLESKQNKEPNVGNEA